MDLISFKLVYSVQMECCHKSGYYVIKVCMTKILTNEQMSGLRSRHRIERDRRVADRIKAALLYDMGWSYEQIAEALLLSDEAIKHIKDFEQAQRLKPTNGSSKSKVTEFQKMKLRTHIDDTGYTEVREIRHCI